MAEGRKRIAAIDIGTNSIHMIIAETRRGGYKVVDREKEMVQLGLGSLDGEPLTPDAMERGVDALTSMRAIADHWKVDETIAVATSAVREAPNRRDFLRRVKKAAGLDVDVISGEDEARFIFEAVRRAVDLDSEKALCVDIGGGSVELIVGTEDEIEIAGSEPLGALRLSQRFSLLDRAAASSVSACRRFVRQRLERIATEIATTGFDLCVGTSGTIMALETISAPTRRRASGHALRRITRPAVSEALQTLAGMTKEERAQTFGFDEQRAETIVGGAIVVDEILGRLEIESMLVSSAALREGLIESRLAHTTPALRRGSMRRTSVLSVARRTECDMAHGEHVAALARKLFEDLRKLHHLPSASRELLEYAALLHESGMVISDHDHPRHSDYVIRNADLKGFTDEQLAMIAHIARFYRKAPEEEVLEDLTPSHQRDVGKLIAILRIAEALDRGHTQRVSAVSAKEKNGDIRFEVRATGDASVEVATAARRAKYFRKIFDRKPRFTTR